MAKPEAEAFHVEEPAKSNHPKSEGYAEAFVPGAVDGIAHKFAPRMTPEPAAERHTDAHEHNGLKDNRADSRHGVVAVARNFVEAVLELHLRRSIGRCQERGGRNARRLRRGLIDFEFCVGCCGRYGSLNSASLHGICSAAQNMEGSVFASGEMLGIAVRNRYHDGLSLAAEGLHCRTRVARYA